METHQYKENKLSPGHCIACGLIKNCERHSKASENYERDYSHYHCWEVENSPCGFKGLHRCCLCETPVPEIPTDTAEKKCNVCDARPGEIHNINCSVPCETPKKEVPLPENIKIQSWNIYPEGSWQMNVSGLGQKLNEVIDYLRTSKENK